MRIAICEDDKYQRDIIKQYILEHKHYSPDMSISTFSCGEDLLRSYASGDQYALLFLDIQMKDINGIETAHEIRRTNSNTIIFFVTGFMEYVNDAFVVDAFQFLHKPIKRALFDREFSRALNKYHMQNKKYEIRKKSKIIRLEMNEMIYLEVLNHRISIHTIADTHEKNGRIDEEEKALRPYGFVRISRSFLVNMEHIVSIEKSDILLTGEKTVMMSRRRRADVLNQYNQFRIGSA